jgi:hypothetical protein
MDGGALLFARYAYPPNVLGHCGPDAAGQLLEQVDAGVEDRGLRGLVRGFEGAWPYLELIAGATGLDPLDRRVVEAYWVGNDLLRRLDTATMWRSLEDRMRPRLARARWALFADTVPAGAVPHHSFHVLAVYPWLGLLRTGLVHEPLGVLDRCRVRWGRVVDVDATTALVRSRPLVWDRRTLRLGAPRVERVTTGDGGLRLARPLSPGDWCSMHWDWVCDRLETSEVARLATWSAGQLAAVQGQTRPSPAMLLS